MKRFISIILSFIICFTCVFELSINAYMLNSQIVSNEDENVIQSMLEKLETILNLINKTGTITVECVDEDNNVISNKTYEDLKFGTYTYESPEIEGYELNDETSKTVNITKSHRSRKVQFRYRNLNNTIVKEETNKLVKPEEEFIANEVPYVSTNGFQYEWNEGDEVIYEVYITDFDQEDIRMYDYELDKFTFIYELDGVETEIPDIPAGNFTFNLGKVPVGEHKLNMKVRDEFGRESYVIFNEFVVWGEDHKITEEQTYKMTKKDLTTYNISNEKSKVETTLDGLQQLLNDTKDKGFRKIVLLEGTYLFDENKTLEIPDRFTIDMNGSTFKLNPNGLASALMVRIEDTFDSHLINGQIQGDYGEHDYSGNDKNSEWVNGVSISGSSKYSSIEDVKIFNIVGYGACTGMRSTNYCWKTQHVGGEYEVLDEENNTYISPKFYSLDGYPGFIQLGLYLGYQGYPLGNDNSWNYKAHFYDENYKEINTVMGYFYRQVDYPLEAKYAKIEIMRANTEGTNMGNLAMFAFKVPENCSFENLSFEECRCVATALSAAKNFKMENCYFTKNGKSGAHTSTDLEDGWNLMGDYWIIGNIYENNYGNDFLCCASHNTVVENHTGGIYMWPRTNSYLIRNNKGNINIVRAGYDGLARTGYTRIENVNTEGTIHAEGQVIKNCKAKSIYTGPNGKIYNCEIKAVPDNSPAKNCTLTLDSFSSYTYRAMLKNCDIYPFNEEKGYGISFNKYNQENLIENCYFHGKSALNQHNQFNSGIFNNCIFDDVSMTPGVNNEENQKITFNNCTINSTQDYFIKTGGAAYNRGKINVEFNNCKIKQEVNKPLIYIYGGTIDGTQVTFNNCTLNKPLGYILDSYYRDSETNDERFTLNFNNTKFDKDRMLNPDKLTEDLGHYKVNYVE